MASLGLSGKAVLQIRGVANLDDDASEVGGGLFSWENQLTF